MRRYLKWSILLLAVMLAIAGMCQGYRRNAASTDSAGIGSAGLGLVLLDSADAVYVLAVSEHSAAHLAGFEPGDYILGAQGQSVQTVDAFDELLETDGGVLELTVRRQDRELMLSLPCR